MAGSQSESRASHGCSLPYAHQATDPSLMSPRRACPHPQFVSSLTGPLEGQKPCLPALVGSAVAPTGGQYSQELLFGVGSGQFWDFLWGAGVTEEEVQPCPQLLRQSGPCLLRWARRPLHRALPPSATAFLWQLLPTPRRGLQPRREASPSGLWLAVRPASAHPAVRFPIRE